MEDEHVSKAPSFLIIMHRWETIREPVKYRFADVLPELLGRCLKETCRIYCRQQVPKS
jgi:hypothetical protein